MIVMDADTNSLVLEMVGKGQQQTARKPATKFVHLRRKMATARIMSTISKKK
jgi:hypothetical protein